MTNEEIERTFSDLEKSNRLMDYLEEQNTGEDFFTHRMSYELNMQIGITLKLAQKLIELFHGIDQDQATNLIQTFQDEIKAIMLHLN